MKTGKISLKWNILLLVCYFAFAKSFAQQSSNIKDENCIKEKVNIFFIEKDKLNGKEASGNSVHILEIVEKRVLGYDKFGIYFCSNAPSKQKYFLLKNESKFKILASNDSLEIMQEVVSFLKTNKISEEKSITYIKECLNILNENMSKQSEKRLSEQQWISCR